MAPKREPKRRELINLRRGSPRESSSYHIYSMHQALKESEIEHISTHEKYKFLIWELETPIKWNNLLPTIFFHIFSIYMVLTFPYLEKPGTFLYACMLIVIGAFGVTAGGHRYWSHRSFKAKLPLRLILLFSYTLAGEYSIKYWVRDHRLHHKYTDTIADPHCSRRGFVFSHVGWLMMKRHPEVLRRGKEIDYSDIFEDPLVAFHQRYYFYFLMLIAFILPSIIPPLLWGESWITSILLVIFPRYIICLNYIWTINSAAHIWGTKPYDKNICPAENLIVSLLASGEGYHNYHHTFPWDYRASEVGKYLNLTMHLLNFFHKIGWAYDMKTASPELVRKVVENKGDGSHYKWGHEVPEESSRSI